MSISWRRLAPAPKPAYLERVDIRGLVGVYRADGGVRGEFRYLIDHYLRGESCSLCDITHSPFRRKAAWDQHVDELDIPFTLLHLNELDDALAQFVGDRAACVVADTADGRALRITNDELASLDGSVEEFLTLLRTRLAEASN